MPSGFSITLTPNQNNLPSPYLGPHTCTIMWKSGDRMKLQNHSKFYQLITILILPLTTSTSFLPHSAHHTS